jgi:hypothetical protein
VEILSHPPEPNFFKRGGAGFIVISWSFDLVPTSQWILKLSKMAILIKASIKEPKQKVM